MRWLPIVCGLLFGGCGDEAQRASDSAAPDAAAETETHDDVAPGDSVEVAPEAEVTPDVTPEVAEVIDPPNPGSFRWDLAAVAPADFYAYPWPSDLRTNARGAADLSAFPSERAHTSILGDAISAVEGGPPGFSPLASAYFGLAVELDPASIPGNVLLVDVDRGERLAATPEWNAPGGGYWPARTLAVHADYQQPPRAGARIAAILLNGLRTADGAALEAPASIAELDLVSGAEADSLRALLPALSQLGLTRADLLAWTTWRAADPMAELRALAGWVQRETPPATSELTLVERKPAWDHYQGKVTLIEAMAGDPPFTAPFGSGLIELLPDGAPATPRIVTIPFTLTVPRSEMPEAGFPLVLYGHGLGETHDGFLRTAAAPLAARGVAVIGLDPPLQGTRNTTGIEDRMLIVTLSVGNIIGGREILRQGVFDYLQLARAVASPAFEVPAAVAPDGIARRFDATRLGYFGHSEGAQIGALLLPLEPSLGPAVFSEGGGGAAITMLVLKLDEIDVSATVAEFLGIDFEVERWVLGHPLVTAVIQPVLDAADPLHLARHIVREPLAGGVAHDLVMLEGFLDKLTPAVSIEALVSAIGLPIAEPVARDIAGLLAQSIAPAPLPASGNLPPVAGRTPTGALLQLPEEDHYIIYFNAAVKAQLMDFLASALAGETRLESAAPRDAVMERPWVRPMRARDPHEPHRVATPLELLFDLCFVVAIAQVAGRLHHAIVEHHVAAAIPAFAMVFFAIWWAWMNFTWFASAYDVDDTPYRLKVLVQICGVLVLAAGVARAFDRGDFTMITLGYTIMRVALVLHWLRAARSHPERRKTALRFAAGLVVVQLVWLSALLLPLELWWLAPALAVPLELAVPWWAEAAGATPWHPHHIAERYGLLTLIVLGESVLAATMALQAAIDAGGLTPALAGIVVGGVLTLFAMWWIYFDSPAQLFLRSTQQAFIWGYGHLFVFGSAAAVGAGLAVAVDQAAAEHASELGHAAAHAVPVLTAGLAVGVPVALFVLSTWLLHVRPTRPGRAWAVPFLAATLLILVAAFTPCPVLIIGLVMAALVACTVGLATARLTRIERIHSP